MIWYLLGGVAALVVTSLIAGTWFAFRAGRNAARVQSEAKDAATANEEAAASQRALSARTNGIRSNNQLLGTLDKGQF